MQRRADPESLLCCLGCVVPGRSPPSGRLLTSCLPMGPDPRLGSPGALARLCEGWCFSVSVLADVWLGREAVVQKDLPAGRAGDAASPPKGLARAPGCKEASGRAAQNKSQFKPESFAPVYASCGSVCGSTLLRCRGQWDTEPVVVMRGVSRDWCEQPGVILPL